MNTQTTQTESSVSTDKREAMIEAVKSITGTPAGARSRTDVAYHKVRLTPGIAQEILDAQNQASNRRLDAFQVQRLADLIKEGKWNEDVGSILITKKGRLIDGQHRLSAIVKANKPVTALVGIGVDEDVMKFVDTGKRRTTGQTLAILGQQQPAVRLAAANLLAQFEKMTRAPKEGPLSVTARLTALDPDSVIEYLEKYEQELREMGPVLNDFNAACVYGPLAFAARKHPEAAIVARDFMRDGQVAGNPVLEKFHGGQKRLLKKDLGSGTERAEAILYVFDLVRALETGKVPKNFVKVEDGAEAHTALLKFFGEKQTD